MSADGYVRTANNQIKYRHSRGRGEGERLVDVVGSLCVFPGEFVWGDRWTVPFLAIGILAVGGEEAVVSALDDVEP